MNLLAIDYGKKRIGIAFASASFAEPIALLDNTDRVNQQIIKLVRAYKAQRVIVGLSEGEMAQETKTFAAGLEEQLKLPLVFHDETLSSYEANSKLMHKKRGYRAKPQDSYQAAVMLQDYLDSHTSPKKPKS